MFENLELLRMSHALAVHAGTRQSILAGNVAHANTPGYQRRDLRPFTELYDPTRRDQVFEAFTPNATESPNGNTVSVEREIMYTAEVRRDHEMALSIYKSSLDILRTSLGRRG